MNSRTTMKPALADTDNCVVVAHRIHDQMPLNEWCQWDGKRGLANKDGARSTEMRYGTLEVLRRIYGVRYHKSNDSVYLMRTQ